MTKNLLITGHPGVGKTTLLKEIVSRSGRLALSGFYCEEIREQGIRVGFRAVTLSGSSAVFAHVRFNVPPRHRVGKYGVRPDVLESLVLPHIDSAHKKADLMVVDEIAKMELISEQIRKQLHQVLESDQRLIATIALKGTGFIKQVKERGDAETFTLTLQNRDVLGAQILRRLHQMLPPPAPFSELPEGRAK